MANLDDLDLTSITEMNTDEQLDMLRRIRLNRRVQQTVKVTKAVRAKAVAKKQEVKVDANLAAELLKIITGGTE